jgi:hypothetical protein|tara:strand:- start:1067 stop:1444 length:378 start_codon:yes stop_codon:yes gene_type:complete
MIVFKGARERVRMGVPRPEILKVIDIASIWSARSGVDVIVNSLNDHKHMTKSLHYEDLAVDLSVTPFNVVDMAKLVAHLERMLVGGAYDKTWHPSGYDIIHGDKNHKRHVHVEYDVRQRKRQAND